MRQVLCALSVLLFAAVAAAGGKPVKAEPGDWYYPLKGIPAGPGKLDFGGSLRFRWEYADNSSVRTYNTRSEDDVLLWRTRVWGKYTFHEDAFVKVMLQDSRACFTDQGTTQFGDQHPYYDPADVREAYAGWQHIGGTPLGLKIGRQTISYGDKRIFGPGLWGNVGRYAWDAGIVTWDAEPVQIDLIAGQRVLFDQHGWDNDRYDYDMFAVYAQIKKLPATLKKWDVFWTLHYDDHNTTVGESGVDDRKTHTVGTYADGGFGEHWDYGGTIAVQRGKWGRDDIDAWGMNGRLGYTFDAPWTPRVGVQYSYASGDSNPNDGDHETFDNVFGAIDCYFGRMNYFAWMNLEDYQLDFSVKPRKDLEVALGCHFFRLAQDRDAWYYGNGRAQRRDATGTSGSTLGQEVDLTARWQIRKDVELFAGIGHFFTGAFINHTGRHGDANWGFLQVMYKF